MQMTTERLQKVGNMVEFFGVHTTHPFKMAVILT